MTTNQSEGFDFLLKWLDRRSPFGLCSAVIQNATDDFINEVLRGKVGNWQNLHLAEAVRQLEVRCESNDVQRTQSVLIQVPLNPSRTKKLYSLNKSITEFQGLAAPVAEWLRSLIFSTLIRLSSHCCGFQA